MKELTTRGYLDATDETVDCLLLFIPNESVYAFVQEHDRAILDDAMRNKVVLCSPLTLYAVLAVVRQAVDNFCLERTSNEILSLLGEFALQWEKYATQLDRVQQRFDGVAKEYAALMTTRHRALQRPLDKIESLRQGERTRGGYPGGQRGRARAARERAGERRTRWSRRRSPRLRSTRSLRVVTHVAVLGGGQLGLMLGLAGIPLGCSFTFLDPVERSACARGRRAGRRHARRRERGRARRQGRGGRHVRVGRRARGNRARPGADGARAARPSCARRVAGSARREGDAAGARHRDRAAFDRSTISRACMPR